MIDFNQRGKNNLTDRCQSVNRLIAPSVNGSFDEEAAAQERVGNRRTNEKHSSFHPSAGFFVGCSDYPAEEIERASPAVTIFHNNIANLVAATDINCLLAMQYAVEVCRVENIVVVGHHGCRGVKAAIENIESCVLNSWLRPVMRLAGKYKILLEQIGDASDRLDALCELNVIEQLQAACSSTVVQAAWSKDRELLVSGLIYDRQNRLLESFYVHINGRDSLAAQYAAAIADFKRRWKICGKKSDQKTE